DFLNTLLEGEESTIVDLTFISNEQLGKQMVDRRAVFDIYCENEKGEKFIVELQKSKQNFFKDRSVFYSSFPIQEQGQKGNWNFELKERPFIPSLFWILSLMKIRKTKKSIFTK
ncbi:hypothetical protein ERW53_20405, partial [Aliivibrio finisterrensis]